MKSLKFELLHPLQGAALLTVLSIALLVAIYHETTASIIHIWRTSDTFAHCFLIFPISAYLIWQRRAALARLLPCADWRAAIALAALGFGWLLGNLADAKVIQQFALVGMIPMLVWAILGWRVASEIAFPLGFLLFSVPFGEFLIPRLVDFTADFTVGMLKLTGIPVYREGTFFSIPSGDWSVVEACSGLRYLIASITLGALYAYINYRSLLRRAVFIVFASIVPVIANGLRAYMIVMIAHLSDMTLAMGVDHFIYGWVFFGLVMALMFWIGSKWSEEPADEGAAVAGPAAGEGWRQRGGFTMAIAALAVSAIWPARAAYTHSLLASQADSAVHLAVPEPVAAWRPADPLTSWEPTYHGATAQAQWSYSNGRHTVTVFLKYYRAQEQGRELVNTQNILCHEKQPDCKLFGEAPSAAKLAGREVEVLQSRLEAQRQQLLVWRWYWVGGEYTANDYLAKLYEAKDKLLGHLGDEAGIIVVIDTNGGLSEARAALQDFVEQMLPSIRLSLNGAAGKGNT